MDTKIKINSPRLLIRSLLPTDVCDDYIEGLNDPEVKRYLFDARFVTQTRETVLAFVKKNRSSPADILFGFFDREKNLLIGTLRVSAISKIHFSASIGICIFRREYWGKGLGTEAVQKVVEYLFRELGLHYVEAGAYQENTASIRMFQKAGFEIQAEYPCKYRYENDFRPVVFLGVVNPAFVFSGC